MALSYQGAGTRRYDESMRIYICFELSPRLDDKKIAEVSTKDDGKASISLEPGEYYLKELKAPFGYLLEPAKIYCKVATNQTVTVEVTDQRDETITDNNIPLGGIDIPKTGEDFPTMNYTMGALLLAAALMCSIFLYRKRKNHLAYIS